MSQQDDMFFDLVMKDANMLALVPDEDKTREMCLMAVCQSPFALKDVPEDLRTDEIYEQAFSCNFYFKDFWR